MTGQHGNDTSVVATTHNTARFFTENRQISWVLLVATVAWGVYGYYAMPKLKDPETAVNDAVAVTVWPGASAESVEQLVTRRIEERIAENANIIKIESTSRSSVSIVTLSLDERVSDTGREFDDIKLKLDGIRDLPAGAGPIEFFKDYGDTATLMLTVASPKRTSIDIDLRADMIRAAIEKVRSGLPSSNRASLVVCYPSTMKPDMPHRRRDLVIQYLRAQAGARDIRSFEGSGFVGIDAIMPQDDAAIVAFLRQLLEDRLQAAEFHPDVWEPALIRRPEETATALAAVAGDQYTYRELDEFSDLIKRSLQTLPQVSKIYRSGLLAERVYLEYSQERLAGQQRQLGDILGARNITVRGGMLQALGRNVLIDPSGEFKNEQEMGDVMVGTSETGRPLYLRDSVDIIRAYEDPPPFLNFYRWRDAEGAWQRTRAITLAIQMRRGQQIGGFGTAVDAMLAQVRTSLPQDLILARVSDQPLQVEESVSLFMKSLLEAIVLVVLVALIGFWEWRSALLMALSIPITLAMTFGMMHFLGIDLQQVSIASLIIALGLLVDDPVVAGDAIKRELDMGQPRSVAAWLGPTKLATAILFATITNIVAYLPLLMLSGNVGRFIYSLPVVLACSLIASRIVSMTFIPLLGYYLLRPSRHLPAEERPQRDRGFASVYYRFAGWAVDHRWVALSVSLVLLMVGVAAVRDLEDQFFPKDLSYLSYVDVWLPQDSAISETNVIATAAENVIAEVARDYAKNTAGTTEPRDVLESVTSYVGGGGPRFWFSVYPEAQQPNYAQLIIKVKDKHDTAPLIAPLQQALTARIPGARIDVRQLETGEPVGVPVAVRLTGDDIPTLRRLADELRAIFRAVPQADRVRDDWGAEAFVVRLQVDSDRANFAGISNLDVALSSAIAMNGYQVTTLRDGNQQIPVVARLRAEERAQLSDIQSLYVYALAGSEKVPLNHLSSISYGMETAKIVRRNQFRTLTVSSFPSPGVLPSTVLGAMLPQLQAFQNTLPPRYRMEIGGEQEEQEQGFGELAVIMAVSIGGIFLALVFQFKHAIKPLIVFSAIPFGVVGALAALKIMNVPFGFMAFLGVASLIGVIVSHVIVLFDFIETMHERGEPLREALLDAGIVRLRPVLITVGATVFGLVPLAISGGPLWEPLCYTQIGGLIVATFITLILVPVLYAIFVLDLRIIKWTTTDDQAAAPAVATT